MGSRATTRTSNRRQQERTDVPSQRRSITLKTEKLGQYLVWSQPSLAARATAGITAVASAPLHLNFLLLASRLSASSFSHGRRRPHSACAQRRSVNGKGKPVRTEDDCRNLFQRTRVRLKEETNEEQNHGHNDGRITHGRICSGNRSGRDFTCLRNPTLHSPGASRGLSGLIVGI